MRNRKNVIWMLAFFIGVGIIILGAMTWGNYQFSVQNPGGNDFLVHWVGARSFLVDGLSPYSDETALRIQNLAYGRPAQAGEHELRVAYPIYSIIFFMPFALFGDFTLARALWMTMLEVGLLLLAFFSLKAISWKPNLLSLIFYFLFSVLWYHSIRPLINGNVIILVALGIVGAMLAIRSGADEVAGVLLALTTIKPQVVIILVVFVAIWAIINHRWRLIAWLLGALALLIASGLFLLPDWILQNIREIIRYPGYNPPGTPGAALAVWFPAQGERLGWVITGLVAILLLIEWIRARKASFRGFLWVVSFTLVLSQWSGIQTDPGNFIVLYPVLVLILALLDERWRKGGWIAGILLMIILLGGGWWLFLATVTYADQPIQSPVLFFPLPGLLILLLYWVRWWAFHPTQTWFDLMYDKDNPAS